MDARIAHNPVGKVATGVDQRVIGYDQLIDSTTKTAVIKMHPHFVMIGTHDFGSSADAVATLLGSAPEKGELLGLFCVVKEAKAGGTVSDATRLTKESIGTTAVSGDIICAYADTVYSNKIGSIVGAAPHATEGNRQVAKGGSVYAYSDAALGRTAGIYHVIAVFKEIA